MGREHSLEALAAKGFHDVEFPNRRGLRRTPSQKCMPSPTSQTCGSASWSVSHQESCGVPVPPTLEGQCLFRPCDRPTFRSCLTKSSRPNARPRLNAPAPSSVPPKLSTYWSTGNLERAPELATRTMWMTPIVPSGCCGDVLVMGDEDRTRPVLPVRRAYKPNETAAAQDGTSDEAPSAGPARST